MQIGCLTVGQTPLWNMRFDIMECRLYGVCEVFAQRVFAISGLFGVCEVFGYSRMLGR